MRRVNAGFSLVELLVCFFISMLLILVLIQHLLSVSRQYQYIHSVLDETIELQWVFDVMRARIHHAGFTPCLGLNQLKSIDTRDRPEALDAITVQQDKLKGPALFIRKMDETQFGLVEILASNRLRIKNIILKSGNPVIVSDCMHAEVHEVSKISQTQDGQVLQLKKPLAFDYAPEVYIGRWVSERFFFRRLKGLFIQQKRIDFMTAAKSIKFNLHQNQAYPKVVMVLVSKLDKKYVLEARTRM
ncbi:MAG: prepilin-type N-terminal cleavage/methylation domain-containing protein [Legionellaceae bacterium]|nr:prepilin-type N-terminal cleavage/methylation domain-containing protein [Legionellaceae bacterium]